MLLSIAQRLGQMLELIAHKGILQKKNSIADVHGSMEASPKASSLLSVTVKSQHRYHTKVF